MQKELKMKKAEGTLPDVLPEPLRLNLGCGNDFRPDYLNLDIFADDERVIFMDVRKLDFADSSVDEILAHDILEHFSHRETANILKEWARVLKPGGILKLRIPSLELQVKAYMRGDWDADVASYMIFGGQTSPGDFHSNGFDKKSIKRHLQKAGFQVTNIEELDVPQKDMKVNLNMEVQARKSIPFQMEKKLSSSSPLADLDFDDDEEETVHQLEDFTEEDLNFDMSILEDFVKDDISKEKSNTEGPKLNIVWEGSQFVYHSLALVNREHCLNILESKQANLNIIPFEPDTFDHSINLRYQPIQDNLVHLKKPVSDEIGNLPYVWIRHQWPTKAERPKGARWIIMQPWEYDVLLESLANIFSYADELWTPSEFSRKAFINSGLPEDKVHVIPNGINPDVFKPDGEILSLPTEKRFKILYVGGTIHRKGIDVLLKSYRKAFTAEDDVCLVIKDIGENTFYKNQTAASVIEEMQLDENCPEILHLSESMAEEDIAALYRTCNLYVSPYRGEGFSLPTLEAMACGLPVVVTRGGATDDFVKEKLGFFLDSEKHLVGNELDGNRFVKDTYLLEPNMETLIKTMQFLFANPGILKSMGLTASYHARSKWTWKLATLKALARLDVLYGTDMATQAVSKLTDTKDASFKLGYAETLYAEGKYFEAYTEFKGAIATDKLNDLWTSHAYNRLAIIAIEKNDLDEAREYISKSESFLGDSPDLLYTTAVYYAAKKDFDSALQYITVGLQRWNENKFDVTLGINLDDILVLGGDIMRAVEDLDGAVEMYKNALKINHENYFACHGAGVCFLLAEEYPMAKEMFEWALKYNPTFTPSLEALGKCQ